MKPIHPKTLAVLGIDWAEFDPGETREILDEMGLALDIAPVDWAVACEAADDVAMLYKRGRELGAGCHKGVLIPYYRAGELHAVFLSPTIKAGEDTAQLRRDIADLYFGGIEAAPMYSP